jgi:hypothetical protein
MNLAEEAIKRLEIHEAQCAERLLRLTERVDEAHAKIDSLSKGVWAIYPFIVGTVLIASYLK